MLQDHPVPEALQVAVPDAHCPLAPSFAAHVPVAPGVQGHVSFTRPLQFESSPAAAQLSAASG